MRARTPITLLVLLVFVIGAGWFGWEQFNDPYDNPFGDSSECVDESLAKGTRLKARQVTVNVYNAGNREGLAGQTMERLQRRGFRSGTAENAPTRISVDRVAIYDSEPRSAEVTLVRRQFTGKVRLLRKPDIAEGVDVVVGSGFRGIERSAKTALQLSTSEDVCVPDRR